MLPKNSLTKKNNITYEFWKFKKIEYLPTIIDWMESNSGFDGNAILQSMEKHYNELLENSKSESSLVKNILVSEAKYRILNEMGITVNI